MIYAERSNTTPNFSDSRKQSLCNQSALLVRLEWVVVVPGGAFIFLGGAGFLDSSSSGRHRSNVLEGIPFNCDRGGQDRAVAERVIVFISRRGRWARPELVHQRFHICKSCIEEGIRRNAGAERTLRVRA
jgi:hypothetical protein